MILYHYTTQYQGQKSMVNDFERKKRTVLPMCQAAKRGSDTLDLMLLSAQYLASHLNTRSSPFYVNYNKDAAEAIFEVVRQSEFPLEISRIDCVYYCRDKATAIQCLYDDWINCGDRSKEQCTLLEVEVADDSVTDYDQTFYNLAYEAIEQGNIAEAYDYARKYFSREQSDTPIWETLSNGENLIVRQVDF